MKKHYKCNNCGQFYFGITQNEIKEQIYNFNKMFNDLSKEDQQRLYNGEKISSINFENCLRCGNNFMNFSKEALPKRMGGVTISGIAKYDEIEQIRKETKLKIKSKIFKLK